MNSTRPALAGVTELKPSQSVCPPEGTLVRKNVQLAPVIALRTPFWVGDSY
jgi:hypothetical protein